MWDWTDRALSEIAGRPLPYSNLGEVRKRMAEIAPHLARFGELHNTAPFAKEAAALAKVHPPRLLK